MAFLRQNHLDRHLAELVGAINPSAVKQAAPLSSEIRQSIDDANRLVAQAEADGKGLPILLRQYLKLNARLIAFNVDPDFGDGLDALMMVDLTAVDSTILNRYFRTSRGHRVPRSASSPAIGTRRLSRLGTRMATHPHTPTDDSNRETVVAGAPERARRLRRGRRESSSSRRRQSAHDGGTDDRARRGWSSIEPNPSGTQIPHECITRPITRCASTM